MKLPIFTGSGTAIVTPFSADGSVNLPALGRLLERQLLAGTDAVIVCGTTGEAATMTYSERMRTIEFCVRYIDGRIPVIAGTGSNNTATAVTLSRDAAAAGADALLLVTPYYNKATQEGLIRHFRTVADAVSLPQILYNVPSRTGVSCTAETYAALSEHPQILGVKEASGDLKLVQRTRLLCPDDFYIWSGNDDETVPICVLGGVGVISVAANLVPREMHRMTALCLENRFQEAGALQLQLRPMCDALFCEVNPIPVKTALELMGFDVGPLRLPLCPPSAEHLLQIRRALDAWSLDPADPSPF